MAINQPGIQNTTDPNKPWNRSQNGNNVVNNQFKPLTRDDGQRRQIKTFRGPTDGSAAPAEAANDSNEKLETIGESQESLLTQINDKLKIQTDAVVMNKIITQSNNNVLVGISSKLSVLSDKLHEKYAEEKLERLSAPEPTTSESLDSIAQTDPEPTQNDRPEDRIQPSQPSRPSDELLEGEEPKKSGKEMESQKDAVQRNGFKVVEDTLKKGFKSSVSAFDKVSDFLFKNTLKQAIEIAKIAALIFSIVVAIDVIRAYWAAWGSQILEKIDEWVETFRQYWAEFTTWGKSFSDMTTMFDNMNANLAEIKNAWISGDFPALAGALGSALFDLQKTIAAAIARALAGVVSPLLRLLGFKDAADSVEAGALRLQQSLTDSKLSKENQRKVAEDQVKKENDGKTTTERGMTDFLPAKMRNKMFMISDAELNQINSEKNDQSSRSKLSHEDKVQNTMATNEAREAIARYKKYADAANPNDKGQMAKLDKYKSEAQGLLSNPNLSMTPTTKKELDKQFSEIGTKQKPELKPAPVAQSEDNKLVNSIKESGFKGTADNIVNNSTANVNNIVTNSNRTIHVQAPVTSTTAPGVYKANGVN